MIQGWGNSDAKEVFEGRSPRSVPAQVLGRARRMLAALNAAVSVMEMASPPGNRLKKLEGSDIWSVRVNNQFRITFKWGENGPEEVWLGDYH